MSAAGWMSFFHVTFVQAPETDRTPIWSYVRFDIEPHFLL